MTRRDYELIARTLNDCRLAGVPEAAVTKTAQAFGDNLYRAACEHGWNFNLGKFLSACGVRRSTAP